MHDGGWETSLPLAAVQSRAAEDGGHELQVAGPH